MSNDILQERGKTHGNFALNASVSQELKQAMKTENWDRIDDVKREALEVIALKISRICSGNPDFRDHWVDIIGYATLALNTIPEEEAKMASTISSQFVASRTASMTLFYGAGIVRKYRLSVAANPLQAIDKVREFLSAVRLPSEQIFKIEICIGEDDAHA